MVERRRVVHKQYMIIAATLKDKRPAAVVWEDTTKLFESEGDTLDDAVAKAKSWIDQQVEDRVAKRSKSHVATEDEYLLAFRTLKIGRLHQAMLRAHANAPARTMTATELAKAAGYESYETANSQYGTLARRIAEYLDIQPKLSDRREEPVWTSILADGAEEGNEQGHWRWVMHTEVAQALRILNMA